MTESLGVPPSDTEKTETTYSAYDSKLILDNREFNAVVKKLREFFLNKNFIEVCTQNRLSILAACEDPFNVETFKYGDEVWPLPQTGQMWLEYELLKNIDRENVDGYFCLTTSYRNEKNPQDGRHDLIFPLFEFETKGGLDTLIELEIELLQYLGYDDEKIQDAKYGSLCEKFGVTELENEHEMKLYDESSTFFITHFPETTSPFWNMKRNDEGTANKVDVILSGHETFGSAERETDKDKMRECFNTIMDGKYRDKLYELFGKERTDKELDDYLKFDFVERCGGGIGVTRLMRSMKAEKLL